MLTVDCASLLNDIVIQYKLTNNRIYRLDGTSDIPIIEDLNKYDTELLKQLNLHNMSVFDTYSLKYVVYNRNFTACRFCNRGDHIIPLNITALVNSYNSVIHWLLCNQSTHSIVDLAMYNSNINITRYIHRNCVICKCIKTVYETKNANIIKLMQNYCGTRVCTKEHISHNKLFNTSMQIYSNIPAGTFWLLTVLCLLKIELS